MTTVVNVKKAELNKRGIVNFQEWIVRPSSVYIGRNMHMYVAGAFESKWKNPFSVEKYGRDKCLEMYRNYIINNKDLMNSLEELRGKELGCWCCPDKCHGDVLISLLNASE